MPTIEGNGTYGVVYSNPRLPYLKKYKFYKKSNNNDNNANNDIDSNNDTDSNSDNDTYTDIDSNGDADTDVDNDDYNSDDFLKNEVSKVFFDFECYQTESQEYIYILNNYVIHDDYFNIPLNYGITDKKYIFNNLEFFNYLKNKKKLKDIYRLYLKSKYQITYLKGIKLDKIDIYNNFSNNENILLAVKFLNDNNYLFDDLKSDNLLFFDSKIKIIDFSTLIHINDITISKFKESMLTTVFYHIYNPILNTLLYYYIHLNENNFISIDNIIHNINHIKKYDANIDYILYSRNLVKNTYDFITKNDKKSNIKKIYKDIYFYLYQKNQDNYYNIILNKFTEYFNNKYNNNINNIIKDLISRINIYSLGIIFLEYIHRYPYQKTYDNIFINELFDIFKLCCLQFNIINNSNNSNDRNDCNDRNNKLSLNYICEDNIDNIEILDVDIDTIIIKFNKIILVKSIS